jgi:hypothetical protein
MHFRGGETVCGIDVVLAKLVVKCVESFQWCSAPAAAVDLCLPRESVESLIQELHAGGYLSAPHRGPLSDTHAGKWLASEEADGEAMVLWHVTDLGRRLAKAPIGEPLTRAEADQLLADILERCETINRNPRSSHEIDSVTLYGSLCDPLASEIGDVDVAVVARRRDRIDLANPSPRIQLERMLRANNERADVVVTDESWSEGTVIPDGALRRVVYPKPVDEQSD